MTWVITVNSTKCRIYNYERNQHKLSLLKELTHPEAKLKSSELITDKPGHYKTKSSTRGAYEWASDPKKVELDRFIKSITDELIVGHGARQYKEAIVFAPPQISGMLNTHLNKQVKKSIIGNIKKDYVGLTERELADYLHHHWLEITT